MQQNDELSAFTFHKDSLETLFADLRTNKDTGLSQVEATERLKKYGPNQLPEHKQLPCIVKLLLEYVGILQGLLWTASLLCFINYALTPSDPSNVSS